MPRCSRATPGPPTVGSAPIGTRRATKGAATTRLASWRFTLCPQDGPALRGLHRVEKTAQIVVALARKAPLLQGVARLDHGHVTTRLDLVVKGPDVRVDRDGLWPALQAP